MASRQNGEIVGAEPPKDLFGRIRSRINSERSFGASKRRVLYFSLALLGTVAGFFVSIVALQDVLIKSEFMRILSLIFADPSTVISNFGNFIFLVLESGPKTNRFQIQTPMPSRLLTAIDSKFFDEIGCL